MIAADQPTIFGKQLIAGMSSVSDGSMLTKQPSELPVTSTNRDTFLAQLGIKQQQTSLIRLNYETDDFTRYYQATPDDIGNNLTPHATTILCDGMVTTDPGHAILLPLGDCCGAILYAPDQHVLMVSHLGRHSTEIDGGLKSVQHLQQQYNCDPAQLLVWLSPAAGKGNYPLFKLGGRGLHEALADQLQRAGVLAANVQISLQDTTSNTDYFSYSEFQKGHRKTDGRFAVVAMVP